MDKVIAVQSSLEDVSRLLKQKGYQIIDVYQASKPGYKVDAFLYTSSHPDIVTSYNSLTETDKVAFNTGVPQLNETSIIMLNVTGLLPEEVLSLLEERLHNSR